jgi:hypothetical protein
MFGIFLDTEDGGGLFHRNVVGLLPNYTASFENLSSREKVFVSCVVRKEYFKCYSD